MIKCARDGCDAPATHHVGWKCWAWGFPKTTPPIEGVIGINVCRKHGREVGPEIVGDQLWDIVKRVVSAQGRLPPDRNSIEIVLKPGLSEMSFPSAHRR